MKIESFTACLYFSNTNNSQQTAAINVAYIFKIFGFKNPGELLIRNVRLKLAKNKANAKQYPDAELLSF